MKNHERNRSNEESNGWDSPTVGKLITERQIKDDVDSYYPETFERARGKKEKCCRRESNTGLLA